MLSYLSISYKILFFIDPSIFKLYNFSFNIFTSFSFSETSPSSSFNNFIFSLMYILLCSSSKSFFILLFIFSSISNNCSCLYKYCKIYSALFMEFNSYKYFCFSDISKFKILTIISVISLILFFSFILLKILLSNSLDLSI